MTAFNKIGKRLANFNSQAYKWSSFAPGQLYEGQCVTYVRGRAKEKLGIEFQGGFSCAREMIDVAKARGLKTQVYPTPNSFLVFNGGTYGHVQFCEEVAGDDMVYTEANLNGDARVSADDGLVKVMKITDLVRNPNYLGCVVLKPRTTYAAKVIHKQGLYLRSRFSLAKKYRKKLLPYGTKIYIIKGSSKKGFGKRRWCKIRYNNRDYRVVMKTLAGKMTWKKS